MTRGVAQKPTWHGQGIITTLWLWALSLAFWGDSHAALIEGTSSGIFVNSTPASAVVSGVGTNSFTWGVGSPGPPSKLTFTGAPFSGDVNNPIAIGALTYFNGTTQGGTEADKVDLEVTMTLAMPTSTTQMFTQTLDLINSPNVGTPQQNADTVFLPAFFPKTSLLTVNGIDYTLSLIGFGSIAGGGFVSTIDRFHVLESGTASATLLARIFPPGTLGAPGPGKPASGIAAEPINTATGNYFYQRTDRNMPGRGLPFAFTRTYNTLDSYSGPFGQGWTHSYNILLAENADGSVVIKQGDGHEEFYDPVGGGNFQSRFPGIVSVLVKNSDSSFALTAKDQTQHHFDAGGKLASIVDKNGNQLGFGYDGGGNLNTITDTVGRQITLSYDASNRIILITDPIGQIVQYSYDAAGNLVSDTDANDGVMHYAYDASRRLTRITDRRGNVLVENTHDASGRVVAQTNGRGFTTTLAYGVPRIGDTSITDARGNTTIHTHDAQFRLIAETDALGHVVQYTYDADNNRTAIIDKNGNLTSFIYDARGNVTSRIDALGNVTNIAYDGFNNPTRRVDALGNITTFGYDANGNLTSVTDPLGNVTSITRNAFGEPATIIDARGNTTTNTFDSEGNLVNIRDAQGQDTAFTYDSIGRRTAMTDANGSTTQLAYDNNGNLLSVTDPLGSQTAYTYDANNNRTDVTDPRGHTTTLTYDANDLLSTVTDPLGNVTSFAYDAADNRTGVTDPRGNVTRYSYDALGRLLQVIDPAGGIAAYAYDEVGNRTAITDPNGNTTAYTYDTLNRLIGKTDPLGNVYGYGYDAVGNHTALTDAKSQTILYSYDGVNRLTEILYPDTTKVMFGYDAAGNRTQMVDTLGTSRYQYDALNRLTRYTDPFGRVVANQYDAVGNRAALVYPDGKRVVYAYDVLNRMSSVTDWLGGMTSYSYDDASNLAATVNPNSTTATYVYDNAERLIKLVNAKADASILANYDLTLDAVSNRTGIDKTEPLAPLLRSNAEAYSYDPDNRLLSINTDPVTHDANGNLTAKPGAGYQYDFEDRLVTVTGSAQYGYDGVGNRLKAIRSGVVTRYTLDLAGPLSNVLVESDALGIPTAYYVHGLGLISRITPGGDARYYHYDTIGSTAALTDSAGNVTDSYAYDPFGQVLNSQRTVNNPFLYVGQFGVMEEGNGLQFMRARYYNSGLGRFVSKDPLIGDSRIGQTLNGYAYVLNNPLRYLDVTGLSPQENTAAEAASQSDENLIIFFLKKFLPGAIPKLAKLTLEGPTTTGFPTPSGALQSVAPQLLEVSIEGLRATIEGKKNQIRNLQYYVDLLGDGIPLKDVVDIAEQQTYGFGLNREVLTKFILDEAKRQGVTVLN